jgi:predicted ATP-binding protein involved in virulence
MSGLNAKRSLLQKIGLLDAATSSPFDVESLDALAPGQSNVMSLYVEDTQNKLEVLDDLSQRVALLLTHINGKFRNKSIQISRDKGFVVLGADNIVLDPDSLSSGEQHELVQLYDLLFRVKPGTLVLIDEPELSLHVRWQKKFLPELLEIAKAVQFDAVVATHSPFIVGDRSDLMVLLAADIDA